MLESIYVKGFLQFEELTIDGFTRVNLLVGRNNAGKTSLLEALEILSSSSTLSALFRGGRRRNEQRQQTDPEMLSRTQVDIRHLFRGHALSEGVTFHLQDRETQPKFYVHCEVKQTEPEEEQLRLKQLEPVSQEGAEEGSRLAVVVRTHHAHVEPTVIPLTLMAQPGASLSIESYERRRSATDEKSPVSPVVYLGTQGAGRADLVQLWDGIALTPEEDHVVAAMRLVEPQIERIAFTGRSREADVIVRQSTHKQPVPLGSLGEGTRRMLALSIFLSRASGGVLLIDEIDTGLHYSTLESTWRLVVETAKRLNVQVFATSHSGDCMRALAWLQADDPDLAANVSVHRLEKNAKRSVRYSAEELEIAAQHHIEVRG